MRHSIIKKQNIEKGINNAPSTLLLLHLRASSRLGRSLGEPPTDSSNANNRRALGTRGLEQATLPLPTTESEEGRKAGRALLEAAAGEAAVTVTALRPRR